MKSDALLADVLAACSEHASARLSNGRSMRQTSWCVSVRLYIKDYWLTQRRSRPPLPVRAFWGVPP